MVDATLHVTVHTCAVSLIELHCPRRGLPRGECPFAFKPSGPCLPARFFLGLTLPLAMLKSAALSLGSIDGDLSEEDDDETENSSASASASGRRYPPDVD